ncbi:MAG: hypothetical protein GEU90_02560 [Gemmatimonas sp.]|nr:hypothetical protein [Gemmatimonas sp.]
MADSMLAGRCLVFIIALASTGCALVATPAPVESNPEPLAVADVSLAASLLRLEDSRGYDAATVERAATADRPELRARAALAIGRIRDPAGLETARLLLQDPDTSVAASAAFALGLLADSASATALVERLNPDILSARPTVAAEAATALGRISSPEADDALGHFLTSADPQSDEVQTVAASALVAAAGAGDIPVEAIARWTLSQDVETRRQAAYALAQATDPGAVGILMGLAEDPDPLVRASAVRGLTSTALSGTDLALDSVIDQLSRAIEDYAYAPRIEAARSIGTYSSARAVQALRRLLASEHPHDAVVASEALGRMGEVALAALPDLHGLARDPTQLAYERATAIRASLELDREGSRELLRSLVDDSSWRVRSAVVDGFARFRQAAIPELEILAHDADQRVAADAVQAIIISLGPSEIGRVRPLLLELLGSPFVGVRVGVLQGFAWLQDAATFPLLLDAFDVARNDDEPDVGVAAVEAIADLGLIGMAPERAFFARFPNPPASEVHQRAIARFGDPATRAWGDAPPVVPDEPTADYEALVTRWIAPHPETNALPQIRIDTEEGPIDIVLRGDQAPLTAANFLALIAARFFDGQEWARLVPAFMIQGGDPNGDTTGGPGYTIRDEPNRIRFDRGSVGMALSGRDSAGSQFFVAHSPQPGLDGEFTVFAEVVAGQEALERLLPGQRILSIREIAPSEEGC